MALSLPRGHRAIATPDRTHKGYRGSRRLAPAARRGQKRLPPPRAHAEVRSGADPPAPAAAGDRATPSRSLVVLPRRTVAHRGRRTAGTPPSPIVLSSREA